MRKRDIEYFLNIAKIVAEQSTCPRAHVGAVLVDASNNRIISTGYSGSIPKAPHCEEVGCLLEDGHCRRTVHAEMNALLFMRGHYENLTLYSTHKPCYQCLKALVTANVKTIYYLTIYKDDIADRILNELPEANRPILYHVTEK